MFNNIPQVTKNLLILNALFFLAKIVVISSFNIDLDLLLGAHYINSPLFQPYQIVTHMFMHGNFMHIFFNMFVLLIFGSHLERLWGAKRFFIFYIVSGIGAFLIYNITGAWQIHQLKQEILAYGFPLENINELIRNTPLNESAVSETLSRLSGDPGVFEYAVKSFTPMIGASGALFGIMAAFALLFPNTPLMLLFFPFPIKAKYLIGGYFLIELYSSFNQPGDTVAHLAHVGGAIVGGIIVLIQRRTDKTNFW